MVRLVLGGGGLQKYQAISKGDLDDGSNDLYHTISSFVGFSVVKDRPGIASTRAHREQTFASRRLESTVKGVKGKIGRESCRERV